MAQFRFSQITNAGLLAVGVALGGSSMWALQQYVIAPSAETVGIDSDPKEADRPEGVVEFHKTLWEPAEIQIEPVRISSLPQSLNLTGKVTFNEDHVAHLYPMVEGRVDQVHVKFGQRVKKGDTLVTIQSREIGQANLTLYQDRVLRESAKIKNDWNQDVAKNTRALIEAIKANTAINDIEGLFKSKIIGSYREKLLSAYVNLNKAETDLERTKSLADKDVVANKQLLAAEAVYNADRATLQSLLEQLDQEAQYSALLSAQAVREAETRVRIDESNFKILGYSDFLQSDIDLKSSGDTLGYYPVTAPFDGTIISKDVVLMERASPSTQMLTIADLSSVWVSTDIYEQHLPAIESLSDAEVVVRTAVWPDREFKAKVFYTGDMVNEASRTVGMRSVADNSHGLLKPGMFVNIEVPTKVYSDVTQVPLDAVLEHEGKSFVFVYKGDELFEQRMVTLGRHNSKMVEIVSGVKVDEKVVTRGGFSLKSKLLEDLVAGE